MVYSFVFVMSKIPVLGLVCPSFKDSVLILNRLPDASAYHKIHVSRSLIITEVWRDTMWVFAVKVRDTEISPSTNCICVSHFASGDLLYLYYDHQSYMISSSGGPSLISLR